MDPRAILDGLEQRACVFSHLIKVLFALHLRAGSAGRTHIQVIFPSLVVYWYSDLKVQCSKATVENNFICKTYRLYKHWITCLYKILLSILHLKGLFLRPDIFSTMPKNSQLRPLSSDLRYSIKQPLNVPYKRKAMLYIYDHRKWRL